MLHGPTTLQPTHEDGVGTARRRTEDGLCTGTPYKIGPTTEDYGGRITKVRNPAFTPLYREYGRRAPIERRPYSRLVLPVLLIA